MPVLMWPLALLALGSLPLLAGIYALRQRHRPRRVSSLLLWTEAARPREGGVRLRRLTTPLLFFLELLALILLALAAADPRLPTRTPARLLVVVLDDAYAMRARTGGATPRERALAALEKELGRGPFAARFLLARDRPRTLGEPVSDVKTAMRALEGWHARSPRAALAPAITLARELGGPEAQVLVLSDRAPPSPPGRVQWWAFGAPAENLAFTAAARTPGPGGKDRILLEVTHLGNDPARTRLSIDGRPRQLTLEPGERRRFRFERAPTAGPLTATLGDDALPFDNRVRLEPAPTPALAVALEGEAAPWHAPVRRALAAHPAVRWGGDPAALRISAATPDPAPDPASDPTPDPASVPASDPHTWQVQVQAEGDPLAYTGPFVIDRNHPLTDGLALEGVIWAAPQAPATPTSPGASPGASEPLPVIAAGRQPLVLAGTRPGGRHTLRVRWAPDHSTWQKTPAFPAFWWNLAEWRLRHLPGPRRANVRLGEPIELRLPRDQAANWHLVDPEGRRRRITPGRRRRLTLEAGQPGRHVIERDGTPAWWITVNPLDEASSDLRAARSGRWGAWHEHGAARAGYQRVSWILLLLLLAGLAGHGWLISREGR